MSLCPDPKPPLSSLGTVEARPDLRMLLSRRDWVIWQRISSVPLKFPWWSSGEDSAFLIWGPGFNPWSGSEIPRATTKIKDPACCNEDPVVAN